jgi:hypothetical protein
MKKIATSAAAIAALACVSPLRAHHSISMIDVTTPVWVKGTVVEYKPINPHAMIELEASGEDGQAQRWTVEGPGPGRLDRYAVAKDFLKAGDVIEVCGFVPKHANSYPPPRFVHGQLLRMPNGRMQPWGPYGKLDNCVRPNDPTQSWLDFLNTNPMARELWCNAYTASIPLSPLSSRALVDEINGLMASPCK